MDHRTWMRQFWLDGLCRRFCEHVRKHKRRSVSLKIWAKAFERMLKPEGPIWGWFCQSNTHNSSVLSYWSDLFISWASRGCFPTSLQGFLILGKLPSLRLGRVCLLSSRASKIGDGTFHNKAWSEGFKDSWANDNNNADLNETGDWFGETLPKWFWFLVKDYGSPRFT